MFQDQTKAAKARLIIPPAMRSQMKRRTVCAIEPELADILDSPPQAIPSMTTRRAMTR